MSFPVTRLYILHLSQSLIETFFFVLFLYFFHFLQWNDLNSLPDLCVFTSFILHYFSFTAFFFFPFLTISSTNAN